jgi:hypothetical protein
MIGLFLEHFSGHTLDSTVMSDLMGSDTGKLEGKSLGCVNVSIM